MSLRAIADLPLTTTHMEDDALRDDPFPHYARLRRDAPIARANMRLFRGHEGLILTRYADARDVLTSRVFSSDPSSGGPPTLITRMLRHSEVFELLQGSMVAKDDPTHSRLRNLVNQAFTPRMIGKLEGDIVRIVDELLDHLADRGRVDLVSEFAIPLPLRAIAILLGIDDEDREAFYTAMRRVTERAPDNPVQAYRAYRDVKSMVRLFKDLVARRRADPDDSLVSLLVLANEDGDTLSDQEIVAMIFLLLLAGHDTTANLIGSGVLTLIEHPDSLAQLRSDPDLADSAVEELLRFCVPVTIVMTRTALEDTELAGVHIPKGTPVMPILASANRDEAVFEDPDRLYLARSPNRHLGFGWGAHFCLGTQLARLEAKTAFRGLLSRFDTIELAAPRDSLRFRQGPLRGLERFPISVA